MAGDIILITNNENFIGKDYKVYSVEFRKCRYIEILTKVRDKVHENYRILTHPMAGSLKPNQTPYKSVLLIKEETLDYNSLNLIENAIDSAKKFLGLRKLPQWNEKCLKDFRTLDQSFIEGALLNKNKNSYYIK